MVFNGKRVQCKRTNNTSARGEWYFNDPFKADYPSKPESPANTAFKKRLKEFYKTFNDYDENSHQTRFQFTLHNKMIWVSSSSPVPKLYQINKSRERKLDGLYHFIKIIYF